MTSRAFDVYRNGRKIDTVFYTTNSTAKEAAEEVRRSLIDHDGYEFDIVVKPTRRARQAPAPKADRERAKLAGMHADAVLESAWGIDAQLAREKRCGGYETECYKRGLADDMRAAVEAMDVAADAYEEAGQTRLAEKYRKQMTKFRDVYLAAYERWAYTAPGNENLAYLLNREVRTIGPEREVPIAPRWQGGLRALTRNARATLLVSPQGSYRYVAFDGDTPVSVLQIASRDGREGVISNVYTTPGYRRHGWASRLLDIARRRFRVIEPATDLSPAGAAWTATSVPRAGATKSRARR